MTFGNMFTGVEVGALVIVLWEFVWGLKRGLSGELSRLVSTAMVLTAGLRFYQTLGKILIQNTRLSENHELAMAVAFLLIVICLGVLFLILRLILRLLMTVKFNDKIDRPGGGFVGILRGGLMVILCVFAIGLWPHEYLRDMVCNQSIIGRTVFKYAPPVIAKLNTIRLNASGTKPPPPAPESPQYLETTLPPADGK